MKLNLQINNYTWAKDPAELSTTLTTIAQTADNAGFGALALADHLWSVPPWMGPNETPTPECYTTLAFLAASTSRLDLVALATPPNFRYPGMLAKIVSTLDVLSKGRTWLGIGAGDYEDEALGLGMSYPSVTERFEMLEETVQICLGMWQGDFGSQEPYNGKHFQLGRLLNSPQSLARPHPPILIAGSGEQKTLLLVAKYADACNIGAGPDLPKKLDVLRRHCDAEGRDYDTIEKTVAFYFDPGDNGSKVPALIEQLRSFAKLGVQAVFGAVPNVDKITPLEIIGREVIPEVAGF